MDGFLKAVVYLAVGMVTFIVLWKKFDINWDAEALDMKAMMIACIPLWPLVWLLVLGVWIRGFF